MINLTDLNKKQKVKTTRQMSTANRQNGNLRWKLQNPHSTLAKTVNAIRELQIVV